MFTGIIEEKGIIRSFDKQGEQAYRLVIEAQKALRDLEIGDSISVNGCCLTTVAFDETSISFDLLEESVRLTNFQNLKSGDPVNLERSLRFEGKVGGHFVSGHIDGLGTVTHTDWHGADLYLRTEPPAEFLKYLVYKGSVSIDGVSLTVAEVDDSGFAVWLIPHTLQLTNLGDKSPGSLVNLEFDLLAKYVERLLPGAREFPA